jgi:hypothetical protein
MKNERGKLTHVWFFILIYINDILNENGEISRNLILDKLKYKNNWISEFISLKKAIPNECRDRAVGRQ